MDIKEFVQNKWQIAERLAIENGTKSDTEMAKYILTCMEDADEVCSPEMCELDLSSTKVTAYDYNDEAESLDLFLYVKATKPGALLGDSVKERAYHRLFSFLIRL